MNAEFMNREVARKRCITRLFNAQAELQMLLMEGEPRVAAVEPEVVAISKLIEKLTNKLKES